ncbi:MAG: hypothetical protein WD100_12705 [Tistlia sp.]|uniref:hypothetical protein n=1 Tax=Tistlia sp. TaxID=3057121 RepID=UPI0034A50F75
MRTARRGGEGMLALLALGLWLLMPPVISLFVGPYSLFGIPVLVLYVFGVWLALILATALLARRLPRGERRLPDLPPPSDPEPD